MNKIQIINAPIEGYAKRSFKIVETIDDQKQLYKAQPISSNIHDDWVTIKIIEKLDEKQKIRYPQVLEILKGSKTWSQIITVYDFFEQSNKFYIVMEYGEKTLKEYLKKNQGISLQQKLKYCQQICESIKFIHEQGYMHRDIRPENFIIKNKLIKLTDFGIMRDDPPEDCEQTQIGDLTNQIYTAPEIKKQQQYDKKCDIWSLGCLFYEILTGNQLFKQTFPNSNISYDENHIYTEIQKIIIPLQLRDTIQQMMSLKPENRVDIKEIICALIDNIQILEKQYEMIQLYNEQEKLFEWIQDLSQTLNDSNKMDSNQISIFFNNLVSAIQKQDFGSDRQSQQYFPQNQVEFQKTNNAQFSLPTQQKIDPLKIPETTQPKPQVFQPNFQPNFQPKQPNFQQQQPFQQPFQNFQQQQSQQFNQPTQNKNFLNQNTFTNQQNQQRNPFGTFQNQFNQTTKK